MLGSQLCKAVGWESAVEILTFTGVDRTTVVCDVGNPDIRHFLWLKNFRSYETRIKCTSRIISDRRFVKFDPPDQNDPEDEWTAECVLGGNREFTFSHVKVSSKQTNTGDQLIQITVEIDRTRTRGTRDKAQLQITVTS